MEDYGPCLRMEHLHGGDITNYVLNCGPCADTLTARLCRDALRALAFLHSHDIVHRDVKSEIMLLPSVDTETMIVI